MVTLEAGDVGCLHGVALAPALVLLLGIRRVAYEACWPFAFCF